MQRVTNQSTVSTTVVLDSGVLLFYVKDKDETEQKERLCDVGYFSPTIIVYGDGAQVDRFTLPAGPMGQVVDVVHVDSNGAPVAGEIDVTKDLRRDILRKSDIKYEHLVNVPADSDFEQVFRFTSGTYAPIECEGAEVQGDEREPAQSSKHVSVKSDSARHSFSL